MTNETAKLLKEILVNLVKENGELEEKIAKMESSVSVSLWDSTMNALTLEGLRKEISNLNADLDKMESPFIDAMDQLRIERAKNDDLNKMIDNLHETIKILRSNKTKVIKIDTSKFY